MRAHFIRGEDPKTMMGIGNKIVQLEKRMEQGARIICRDYNLDLSTIKKEVSERGILVEFDGLKPNLVHPYKYWIWYDIERKHFWAGYSEMEPDKISERIGDQKPADSLEKAMLETRIFLNKYNWTAKGAIKESVNFERGIEPIDSMKLGNVSGRKFKKIHKELSNAINQLAVEWWGDKDILSHTDNPYMKIVDNSSPDFKGFSDARGYVEIGVERTEGSSKYYYYLVWSDEFAYGAGYTIDHKKVQFSKNPAREETEKNEIPYDTLEEAINKLTWWYKNL